MKDETEFTPLLKALDQIYQKIQNTDDMSSKRDLNAAMNECSLIAEGALQEFAKKGVK